MKLEFIISFFLFFILFKVDAQDTGSSRIIGDIKDSTLNKVLSSATVSVYSLPDSSLISYTLTNHNGSFELKKLTKNTNILLKISHVSYYPYEKNIYLKDTITNLQKIYLKKMENLIDEVTISYIPPMRMNGDTLEFNADAFKLDSNAVAEDLLKKLPGVIMWGDGTITINGKEIKHLFVNGKPFFGNNSKIATQNIPKTSIDKIQIYQENIDLNNVLDSVSTMNIKLKKGKETGFFGKISGGYGTEKKYDELLNINYFNPKIQLGIIGSMNNINKNNYNIQNLIEDASYKEGVSISNSYPNLFGKGITQSKVIGYTFIYDSKTANNTRKSSKLYSDYINNRTSTNLSTESREDIRYINNSSQIYINTLQNNLDTRYQNFKNKYELKYKNFKIDITSVLSTQRKHNNTINIDSSFNNLQLLSYSNRQSEDNIQSSSFEIQTNIYNDKSIDNDSKLPLNWSISHRAIWYEQDKKENIRYNINFSELKPKNISREIYNSENINNNIINIRYGNFAELFFGKNSKYNFSWESIADIKNSLEERNILEDEHGSNLTSNDRLSYINKNMIQKYINSISLSRSHFMILSNRYQKTLNINFNINQINFLTKNNSTHQFQNISSKYQNIYPKSSINFENYLFGKHKLIFKSIYDIDFQFPKYNDLVPIIDSIGIHAIKIGNSDLLPSRTHIFDIEAGYTSLRSRNIWKFTLGTSYRASNNNISHSTSIDETGRSFYSLVNVVGYNRMNLFLNIDKYINLKKSNIQISNKLTFIKERQPSYLQDTVKVISNNLIKSNVSTIIFNINSNQSIFIENDYHLINSKQSNSSINYRSVNNITKFIFYTKISKNISLKPYFNYYNNYFNKNKEQFLLLNIDIGYRTLKKKNLEFKFSAYDILNKNKNISNTSTINSIILTRTNNLRKYYMFSITYYIRKL